MAQDVHIDVEFDAQIRTSPEFAVDFNGKAIVSLGGQVTQFVSGGSSFLGPVLAVASAANAFMEAQQEAQYRAAVLDALKAILQKLEQIHGRLEDLHDKVDLLIQSVDELKRLVQDIPEEINISSAQSFASQWRDGVTWSDEEYLNQYQDFFDTYYAATDDEMSGWVAVNIPRIAELTVCLLGGLQKYCMIMATDDKGNVDLNKAGEYFDDRIIALAQRFVNIEKGVKRHIAISYNRFIKSWNQGSNTQKGFGLGRENRSVRVYWDNGNQANDAPIWATLGKNQYLRRLGRPDLNFSWSDYFIRRNRKNYFRKYHLIKLDADKGRFKEVKPMVLLPEASVEILRHGAGYPTVGPALGDLNFLGSKKRPIEVWANVFSLEKARKENGRFRGRNSRHERDMKIHLRKINNAWMTFGLLSANRPIVSELRKAIIATEFNSPGD